MNAATQAAQTTLNAHQAENILTNAIKWLFDPIERGSFDWNTEVSPAIDQLRHCRSLVTRESTGLAVQS